MKSLRNKLMMCALLVVSLAGAADAAQRIVFEAPLESASQQVSANFAVNRELGRAWIEVQVETPYQGEEPSVGEVISKAVEGLYYDPARKQENSVPVYWRHDLTSGARFAGPAILAEKQTTTVVSSAFDAHVNANGCVVLTRRKED